MSNKLVFFPKIDIKDKRITLIGKYILLKVNIETKKTNDGKKLLFETTTLDKDYLIKKMKDALLNEVFFEVVKVGEHVSRVKIGDMVCIAKDSSLTDAFTIDDENIDDHSIVLGFLFSEHDVLFIKR